MQLASLQAKSVLPVWHQTTYLVRPVYQIVVLEWLLLITVSASTVALHAKLASLQTVAHVLPVII